jgi:quinolinate synthase
MDQIETIASELFERLHRVKLAGSNCSYDRERCLQLAPIIQEIRELKHERNAVILAHSYLTPDIIYSVADHVGDSYGLSLRAQETSKTTIVFAAVDFMAETAKIMNPTKTVLAPNRMGGCSLAESINGEQVRNLRRQYPDHTFVCYINTTAEVKAECDVSVTSSNVYGIISTLANDKIFFLPDALMGQNIACYLKTHGVKKQLIWSDGRCYVHEQYDGNTIPRIRSMYDHQVAVLAHPECKPEVVQQADFVGSTSDMMKEIKKRGKGKYFLLTECGLGERLQVENPEAEFVGSCIMCKYMKGNTLLDIRDALRDPAEREIHIPEDIRLRAERNLRNMYTLTDEARAKGLM